jgi:hypothetical protein
LFALVAASTTIACAILVPKSGLQGAAQAAVISALLNSLGSAAVVAYALRVLSKATEGTED